MAFDWNAYNKAVGKQASSNRASNKDDRTEMWRKYRENTGTSLPSLDLQELPEIPAAPSPYASWTGKKAGVDARGVDLEAGALDLDAREKNLGVLADYIKAASGNIDKLERRATLTGAEADIEAYQSAFEPYRAALERLESEEQNYNRLTGIYNEEAKLQSMTPRQMQDKINENVRRLEKEADPAKIAAIRRENENMSRRIAEVQREGETQAARLDAAYKREDELQKEIDKAVRRSGDVTELRSELEAVRAQITELGGQADAKWGKGAVQKYFGEMQEGIGLLVKGEDNRQQESNIRAGEEALAEALEAAVMAEAAGKGDPAETARLRAMVDAIGQPGANKEEILAEFLPGMADVTAEVAKRNELAEAGRQAMQEEGKQLKTRGIENIEGAKGGKNEFEKVLIDLGVQGISMGMDATIGAVTGLGGSVPLAVRSFGGAAGQALEAGTSDARAIGYGISSAALGVLSNKLLDGVAGIYGRGSTDDIVDHLIGKIAKTDTGRKAWQLLFAGVGEGAEEVIEDMIDPALRMIYNEKSLNESYSEMEAAEVAYDFMIGAIMGFFGGGIDAVGEPDATTQFFYDAAESGLSFKTALKTWEKMSADFSEVERAKAMARVDAMADRVVADQVRERQAASEAGKAKAAERSYYEKYSTRSQANKIVNDEALKAEWQKKTGITLEGPKGEQARTVMAESQKKLEAMDAEPVATAENETTAAERETVSEMETVEAAQKVPETAQEAPRMKTTTETAERENTLTGAQATQEQRNDAKSAKQTIEILRGRDTDTANYGGVEYSLHYEADGTYTARAVRGDETLWTQSGLANRTAAVNAMQSARENGEIAGVSGREPGLVKNETFDKLRGEKRLTSKTTRELDYLARAIGAEIAIEETITDSEGVSVNAMYADGRISIAVDADDPLTVAAVHEAVHSIKESDEAAFKELAGTVFNILANESESFAQDFRDKARQYGWIDENGNFTEGGKADTLEEMVAQGMGIVAQNGDMLAKLTAEDRGVIQRVLDAINDLVEKIRGYTDYDAEKRISREDAEAYKTLLGHMEELQGKLQTALRDDGDTISAKANEMAGPETEVEKTPVSMEDEAKYSTKHDEKLMESAEESNLKDGAVAETVMEKAKKDRAFVKELLSDKSIQAMLPEDVEGNTIYSNGSYAKSAENSTVCPRSLVLDELANAVSTALGRPLTFNEALYVTQMSANYTDKPECAYCYVAADRKIYTDMLGRYIQQRNAAVQAHKEGESIDWIIENIMGIKVGDGKRDNKTMRKRVLTWIKMADNGTPFISEADLAGFGNFAEDIQRRRASLAPELRAEFDLATKYAQSAARAKVRVKYAAYDGKILKMSQQTIGKLNSMYGLRMYSFTDFSPAFILENMQMFTDAAVKGLKVLAYTKEMEFAEIFAGTGANINISVHGMKSPDAQGEFHMDAMQGADWERAKALRNQHQNVGITFVAESDAAVEWAMRQDWIDVVIPFHSVFGGGNLAAEIYGWKNYKQFQEDKKDSTLWKPGNAKSIYPTEHNNDLIQYADALIKNGLTPRFPQWCNGFDLYKEGEIDADEFRRLNPNYMKLVNECRRSAKDTPAVQPIFDTSIAEEAIDTMVKRGGFYEQIGGSDENMLEIADEIAEEIRGGKAEEMAANKRLEKWSRKAVTPEQDAEYAAAVERGDIDDAQQMADKAAKAAGYSSPELFHGTSKFGFTKFDPAFSDDGISIFTTTNVKTAETYGKGAKTKVSEKASISPDGFWEAPKEKILELLREYIDEETELASDEERELVIQESRKGIEDAIIIAESILKRQGLSENTAKYLKESVKWLNEMAKAKTFESFMDANGKYTDAAWDLKWEDEKISNELIEKTGREVSESYKNLVKWLNGDAMFRGGIEYVIEHGEDIFTSSEALHQLRPLLFDGVYRLYAAPGKQFEIDAKGASWSSLDGSLIGKYGFANTREVAKYAKEKGYDSVKIKNVVDSGDFGYSGESDVYIFFDGHQIKSADAVTYDDEGNVIPLSERFNEKNPDIRYSRKAERPVIRPIASGALAEQDNAFVKYLGVSVGVAKNKRGEWVAMYSGRSKNGSVTADTREAALTALDEKMSAEFAAAYEAPTDADREEFAAREGWEDAPVTNSTTEARKLTKVEAQEIAERDGYPVIQDADGNDVQVLPEFTWVQSKERGNYGLVTGMEIGADGVPMLNVWFENKAKGTGMSVALRPDEVVAVEGEMQTGRPEYTDADAPPEVDNEPFPEMWLPSEEEYQRQRELQEAREAEREEYQRMTADELTKQIADQTPRQQRPESGVDISGIDVKEKQRKDAERIQRRKEQAARVANRSAFEGTDEMKAAGIKVSGSLVKNWNTIQQLVEKNRAEKSVNREYDKMLKQYNLRPGSPEVQFARGIANGTYSVNDIPASFNAGIVRDVANMELVRNRMKQETLKEVKRELQEREQQKAAIIFADSEKYRPNPHKMITKNIMNERTPERVLRSIYGAEKGAQIFNYLFRPVYENNAEAIRWANKQKADVEMRFVDSKKQQRELTAEEKAYAQHVREGEGFAWRAAELEGYDLDTYDAHMANFRQLMDLMRREGYSEVIELVDAVNRGDMSRQEAENRVGNIELFREVLANRQAAISLPEMDEDLREIVEGMQWYQQIEEEIKNNKEVDADIITNAADAIGEKYDEYYRIINQFLIAHGHDEIGFIPGYAPHMQPEPQRKALGQALSSLGIQLDEVSALPAAIAGRTADFKPNMRWNPHFQHRRGGDTDYNIVKGFDSYLKFMSDIIYHTDDIMRLRQVVNYFRGTYGGEEIAANLSAADAIRNASLEEKVAFLRGHTPEGYTPMFMSEANELIDRYVESQYADAENLSKYSEFVTWLENYANILAGKQSLADRGLEYSGGRKMLNITRKVMAAFQRANVAGSASSVLNQTAQLPMIATHLGPKYGAQALRDIITGEVKKAGWENRSDFLVGKKGVDMLEQSDKRLDRFVDKLFTPARVMDEIISTMAVRGEYLRQIETGVSDEIALRRADDYARKVMGSRVKGERPQGFESKRLFAQMAHVFQVEAANQFDYVTSDMPQAIRDLVERDGKLKAAKKVAAVTLSYLVQAFLINRIGEELYGGTPAPFDLVGLAAEFSAAGRDMSTERWLMRFVDNSFEAMGGDRVLGTSADEGSDSFDWANAIEAAGYTISSDLPFVRNLAGIAGIGDETLPTVGVNEMWQGAKGIWSGAMGDDERFGGGDADWGEIAESALDIAAQVAPGGRQLKKTVTGAGTVLRGGSYSGGKLRYPVEITGGKLLQAALFGTSALNETDEYYATNAKNLTEKQTFVYKELVADGMSGQDAYEAIQKYREITSDKTLTSLERSIAERDFITNLPIGNEAKLETWLDLVLDGEETSKYETARQLMDMGMEWRHIAAALDEQKRIDEGDGKAGAKATAFAKWVDDYAAEHWIDSEAAEIMKDGLAFWSMVKQEASAYEELRDAGLNTTKAQGVYELWANLKPEDGKKSASNSQKMYALASASYLSDKERYDATAKALLDDTDMVTESGEPSQYAKLLWCQKEGLSFADYAEARDAEAIDNLYRFGTKAGADAESAYTMAMEVAKLEKLPGAKSISNGQKYEAIGKANVEDVYKMAVMEEWMEDTAFKRLEMTMAYGVSLELYGQALQARSRFDADGNGSYKHSEVEAAVDSLNISNKQKAALWSALTSSVSKSNPFDKEIGGDYYKTYKKWDADRKK